MEESFEKYLPALSYVKICSGWNEMLITAMKSHPIYREMLRHGNQRILGFSTVCPRSVVCSIIFVSIVRNGSNLLTSCIFCGEADIIREINSGNNHQQERARKRKACQKWHEIKAPTWNWQAAGGGWVWREKASWNYAHAMPGWKSVGYSRRMHQ